MSTVLKRHIGILAGYNDFKPVYLFACPTRQDGLERHLGRLVGYKDGKPVYAFTSCLPEWYKIAVAVLAGYKDHKPVYLHALDCCEPGDGGGSSSSQSSSSSSSAPAEPEGPALCDDLPDTLHATVTAASGTYAGLLDNVYEVPLTLEDSGNRKWQNFNIEGEFCITVDCGPGFLGACAAVVQLDNSIGGEVCGGADYDQVSVALCDDFGACPDCGPFPLSASVTFTSGGNSITFTVTE